MKNFIIIAFLFLSFHQSQASTNLSDKSITIYWDTSLSMNDNEIEKELVFLENYFKHIKNAQVRLVLFSNVVDLNKKYQLKNGDFSALKTQIESVTYEGVAKYSLLTKEMDSEVNFLFTDGNEVLDKLDLTGKKVTHIVTTSLKPNAIVLGEQSRNTKGEFINLERISIEKGLLLLGVKVMDAITYQPKKKSTYIKKAVTKGILKGNVASAEGVIQGATIKNLNTKKGTVSDIQGMFSLEVKQGDVIEVEYLGKKPIKIKIEDISPIAIFLYEGESLIDEVVIKSTEYKEEVVNDGFGKREKKKVGFAVRTISDETLNAGPATTISQAAAGKMGATQNGMRELDRTIFRGGGTFLGNKFPLIVVDGLQLTRSESNAAFGKNTSFIDPQNVASITVLKGLAATNRYGSEGCNGVILITTKASLSGKATKKSVVNSALLKNNNYSENVSLISNADNLQFYSVFKPLTSFDEVYDKYLYLRDENYTNAQFYIEVSDYMTQWGNENLGKKILLNAIETNSTSLPILKYVAYKTEEKGMINEAVALYQKLAKLQPNDAQSYRDLALIYKKAGKPQKALNIYNKIFNEAYRHVVFSGIYKNVNNEMMDLIQKEGSKLVLAETPQRFLVPKERNIQARLVFEWNSNDAEFELQFVNPQKKFFTWFFTEEKNANRITKGKRQGYYMEEFLLEGVGKGEWIINIESKSNNSKIPLVVKYTLFQDYGTPKERKETKILTLNTLKGKKMVSRIDFK